MEDGTLLNRYWDNLSRPRPESYKEDYELVESNQLNPEKAYKHLRAGAESGWDYSSRWFANGKDLATIQTTDIVPVDLNSLIYHLELKIAQGFDWAGNLEVPKIYLAKSESRKIAIQKYLWNDSTQFFGDYNYVSQSFTAINSLAGIYPLYFKIATKEQAKKVAKVVEEDFLLAGGFVTTLQKTGQQWDYPNGWAPLQWITANGLFNYGYNDLGLKGVERWLKRNNEVFKATGKMMEKYNVADTELLAGGGEYPLQDGFGWSNGVALAFLEMMKEKETLRKR